MICVRPCRKHNFFVFHKIMFNWSTIFQMIESEEIDKYMAEIDKEKEEEAEKKKTKKDKS